MNVNKKPIEVLEKRRFHLDKYLEFNKRKSHKIHRQNSQKDLFITDDPQISRQKEEEIKTLKIKCSYLDNQIISLKLLIEELKKNLSSLSESNKSLFQKNKELETEHTKALNSKEEKIISLSLLIAELRHKLAISKREQRQLEDILIKQEHKISEMNEKQVSLLKEINKKNITIKENRTFITTLENLLKDQKESNKALAFNRKSLIVSKTETKALRDQLDAYHKEIGVRNTKIDKLEQLNQQLRFKIRLKKKNKCNSVSYPISYENNTKKLNDISFLPVNLQEKKKIVQYRSDELMDKKEEGKLNDFKIMMDQLVNNLID